MNYSYDFTQIKFCTYVRKSQSDDGAQILSIPSQIQHANEIAEKNKIRPVQMFKDAETAYEPDKRPSFNAMIESIERGEIDGVICWKADRLARNPICGGKILYLLQIGKLKMIVTQFKIYLPTDNTLPLTIEFGMANQYSRDISAGVKRGNRTKIRDGGVSNLVPQGYLNAENEFKEKIAIIDPDRFDVVRKMWDLMLSEKYSL